MLRIILLGQPGVGKGTVAKQLSEEFNIPHLVSSDVLKEAAAVGDADAQLIHRLIAQGQLVPDELVNAVFERRLSLPDVQNGFLLDGYPRTLPQVSVLHSFVKIDGALLLNASRKVVLARIKNRLKEEGRADDEASVSARRMDVYEKQTLPVVDHYYNKDIVIEVDASKKPEEVVVQCRDALERLKNVR